MKLKNFLKYDKNSFSYPQKEQKDVLSDVTKLKINIVFTLDLHLDKNQLNYLCHKIDFVE